MKKVIYGKELQEKMEKAIQQLCYPVKKTLGPKGSNVIINHSSFSPFITNDGVTIATHIESEDEAIATILEIAKESSIKTNEKVGDGTTTTLVLLEKLYQSSQRFLQKESNPIRLKKELDMQLEKIKQKLTNQAKLPTMTMQEHIATISSGDKQIGKVVQEVLECVENRAAITIEEIEGNEISYTLQTGYSFPAFQASYSFPQTEESCYSNSYILIVNDTLSTIESIAVILNNLIRKAKPLLIIANGFEEYFINEITAFQMTNHLSIFLFQIEEYGIHQKMIQKDIEILTKATIVENKEKITSQDLGWSSSIQIQKGLVRIEFQEDQMIQNYREEIKKEEEKIQDMFEKEFYQKRIAMFQSGLAKITIGAPTKTECRERRMRLEDALCATLASKKGVVPGGGLTLLKIAEEMKEESPASCIWKEALMQPFQQIMTNAGLNSEEIKRKIESENYTILYNVSTEKYESIQNTEVLDSLEVVLFALVNACSIVTMLLTTDCLIINDYPNELNKKTDYTEVL